MNIKRIMIGSLLGGIGLFAFVYAILIITAPMMMITLWEVKGIIDIITSPEIFRMAMSFGFIGIVVGVFFGGSSQ